MLRTVYGGAAWATCLSDESNKMASSALVLQAAFLADLVISAGCLIIPLMLIRRQRRGGKPPPASTVWLGAALVLALGGVHLVGALTSGQTESWLLLGTKSMAASLSILTAVAWWRLTPQAKLDAVNQRSQALDGSLETEVARRRDAEESLDESQQILAFALASIGAGFIATDRQGHVTGMNGVAERLTGWSQAEAAGKQLWNVFVREGRPESDGFESAVDAMINEGVTFDLLHDVVAVSKNGTHTPVQAQAALTHAPNGTVRGVAIVLRDVTPSTRAEAESARLAAIVDSSGDAIIGKTIEGRITTWNKAAEGMFGYRAEEAIGHAVQMLIPEDRKDEETAILARLRRGEKVPSFDTVRLTKSGKLLDVSISISPILSASGQLIGASKIARDITRQRRDAAALLDSEARLRLTLEAARIGDWVMDLSTGRVRHSRIHDQCFGFTEPPVTWSFKHLVEHVHPADRADVEQALHRAVADLRDFRLQYRVIWEDASVHWISMHGSALQVDDKPIRLVGIVSDITDQRMAEEARLTAQRLEAENRRIQEDSRMKSLFLANMSHELRTPLNAIIGFADLLHSGFVAPESPQHHTFLGHIGTSGRHLLQLINDVLDLSKVESGKFEFFPETVKLETVTREVVDILQTAIHQKQVTVSTDIDATLVDMRLDPSRLKQVLYNYLSNAIKFTPAGGRVTVRAFGQGPEEFRLEVEDTGIGIAPADLPRLFTEFQQLDAGYSKKHQGTGLGLALTRRLVQAQGGYVGVRSTEGAGSTFFAVLKRVYSADDPARSDPIKARDRILVIENDQHNQQRLSAAFAEAGFAVDAAFDGDDALRKAREIPYAALTLDLGLHTQRGLDLLADIRNHGASHATPVIGVTMPAEEKAASFSIANLLSKPLRSGELLQAMAPIKAKHLGPAKVLVIDDDQQALDLMTAKLESIGVNAVCRLDGREALRNIDQLCPDAIILDLMMPEFDGFQVLDELRRLRAWREVPVYIWTSLLLTDEEYVTLAKSASAVLLKGGGSMEEMLESVRRQAQSSSAASEEQLR